MSQWLKTHVALAGDRRSVPSTHIRWLAAAYSVETYYYVTSYYYNVKKYFKLMNETSSIRNKIRKNIAMIMIRV